MVSEPGDIAMGWWPPSTHGTCGQLGKRWGVTALGTLCGCGTLPQAAGQCLVDLLKSLQVNCALAAARRLPIPLLVQPSGEGFRGEAMRTEVCVRLRYVLPHTLKDLARPLLFAGDKEERRGM